MEEKGKIGPAIFPMQKNKKGFSATVKLYNLYYNSDVDFNIYLVDLLGNLTFSTLI